MSEENNEWKRPTAFVWTVDDVAKALRVSPSHIYRLVSQRKIPFSKVGGKTRFFPSQIEEWLRKGGRR